MEKWKLTRDTRVAAALGTLGVPIRLSTTIIEATGQQRTTYHLALRSLDGIHQTGKILKAFRSGALEAKEPTHPFLTCMRAMENRRCLLELLHKPVTTLRLFPIGETGIWQYATPGDPLPGLSRQREIFRTTDVKMAAALATVGIPILAVNPGPGGRHEMLLARRGPPRADALPPVDSADFATAWRSARESIPWEEPFAQACRALHNRERLLDAIASDIPNLLVRKPRSFRSAIIPANATNAAWDKVQEHFDR